MSERWKFMPGGTLVVFENESEILGTFYGSRAQSDARRAEIRDLIAQAPQLKDTLRQIRDIVKKAGRNDSRGLFHSEAINAIADLVSEI